MIIRILIFIFIFFISKIHSQEKCITNIVEFDGSYFTDKWCEFSVEKNQNTIKIISLIDTSEWVEILYEIENYAIASIKDTLRTYESSALDCIMSIGTSNQILNEIYKISMNRGFMISVIYDVDFKIEKEIYDEEEITVIEDSSNMMGFVISNYNHSVTLKKEAIKKTDKTRKKSK
jgi:hypothetical protein